MEIEIAEDIDIKCGRCHKDLDAIMHVRPRWIEVEPCEACMREMREEGEKQARKKTGGGE